MSSSDRPQPVLAGQLGAVLTAAVGLAVAFGLDLDPRQEAAILGLITTLVAIAGSAGAWWARRQVTPLANPQDNDGTRLIRVDGQPVARSHRDLNGPRH